MGFCTLNIVIVLRHRILLSLCIQDGTGVAQWLRFCATNRKFAGSIPDVVIGIFHRHNPSDRTIPHGVDSTSNRNEYQEYFLGVRTAVA